ncbi:MAG: hypothetical protein IKU27_05040 [Clostridia bacterium]|nr:hypothetical protein [Clostridia bacterium]
MCWNRRRRCGCCCRYCPCRNTGNTDTAPQPRSGYCTVAGTLRYSDVPMSTANGLDEDNGCGCSSCNNGCGTAVPWNSRCR